MNDQVANAINQCFGEDSPLIRGFEYVASSTLGCNDSEGSLVSAVEQLAESTKRIGDAITPNICGNADAAGGRVESLTEAVMGMTRGMMRIAEAIESLAEAVGEIKHG
jgi:methyl-accepting chemotaxis protein